MSHVARTYYLDQSLFLSRLESSPTDFEPKVFAPFRASRPSSRTHSQLHQLKRKLLRAALQETPETGSFKRICRAANQAVERAWATSYPLLVFPHLFDEMLKAVRDRFQQEQISDAQSSLTSLEPVLKMGGAGDPPAPVGDPPTGTGASNVAKRPCPLARIVAPVSSGESPDGTGGSPVLPVNHFSNTPSAVARSARSDERAEA